MCLTLIVASTDPSGDDGEGHRLSPQTHSKSLAERNISAAAAASRAKDRSVEEKQCSTNEPAFLWSARLNVETAALIADLDNTRMGQWGWMSALCWFCFGFFFPFLFCRCYANVSGTIAPSCRERRVVTCDKANLRGRTGARPNQQG